MNSPFSFQAHYRRATPAALRAVSLAALSMLAAASQTLPAHASHPSVSSAAPVDPMSKAKKTAAKVERDDAAADAIKRVYIEPSVLEISADTPITAGDQDMVGWEIDRQLCFKISQRFEIAATPDPDAGLIRTRIVAIKPTSKVGSAATAAASFFIPAPVSIRGRAISGGLTVETILTAPGGSLAAQITWTKSVGGLSRVGPSLSPVGDALQLADPFAKAVSKAFAAKESVKRRIGKPDPCARFGPRRTAGRIVGGVLADLGTGLYVPSLAGAGRAPSGEAVAAKP
ncbi:DUF3313 family protein [Caulobacter sp.]|uniref:DUF3313 family protein n=1 Tax=Caulobacter sp. TaxID=78 RepID=UPI003BA90689